MKRAVFSLSIGGIDLQAHLTIEEVFSNVQGAFLTPSDVSDVVVMLTNETTKYRYVQCISPALFTGKMATLDAMKRYFCRMSHGYLLIACSPQNDFSFSASLPLHTSCGDENCLVFFMTHATVLTK